MAQVKDSSVTSFVAGNAEDMLTYMEQIADALNDAKNVIANYKEVYLRVDGSKLQIEVDITKKEPEDEEPEDDILTF